MGVRTIKNAMARLPKIYFDILAYKFGIGGRKQLSILEVRRALGLTQRRYYEEYVAALSLLDVYLKKGKVDHSIRNFEKWNRGYNILLELGECSVEKDKSAVTE